MKQRFGEYAEKGDYHKDPDKNWKYYPIYAEKLSFVKKYLSKISKKKKILDAGCGEGVIVEEFKKKGYDITGFDYNYSSKNVFKGDIRNMNFKNNSFDIVLALDIIEHLNFEEQELAIAELKRVLKRKGRILLAIPNLAHFASRISFLFLGKLLRTSSIERHKGDRPIKEYLELLKKHGLKIIRRKGLFPTMPISSILTFLFPLKVVWLHRILNKFLAYPNWCFLNIIELKK